MSVWVILNPSKVKNLAAFQKKIARYAAQAGCQELHWLLTTREESGSSQARQAVRAGAQAVIAAGGDGTVTAVAGGLAQAGGGISPVPMGIIPVGTGNVMARNLRLPIRRLRRAVQIAVSAHSQTQPLDVEWFRIEGDDASCTGEYPFLTLAGVGFDGETMSATSGTWKRRIGWPAYIGGAWKSRHISSFTAHIQVFASLSDTTPIFSHHRQVKAIVASNIGRLPLMHLAPAADYSDGRADLTIVNTRAGLLGWTVLGARLASQYVKPVKNAVLKNLNLAHPPAQENATTASTQITAEQPRSLAYLEYAQGQRIRIELSEPRMAQIDGDALCLTRAIEIHATHHALNVRVTR